VRATSSIHRVHPVGATGRQQETGNPGLAAPRLQLLAGAVGLLVVGAVLWWSGKALPPPTALDHQGVSAWVGTTDPIVAAFAVVRVVGLALVVWIALTGAAGALVHLSRLRRRRWLRRLVDRLSLPVVRRLVHGAAGVTLAAATLVPGTAGASTSVTTAVPDINRPDIATLVAIYPPERATAATVPIGPDRAVIIALDPAPGSAAPPPMPTPAPMLPPTTATPPAAKASTAAAPTIAPPPVTPALGLWRIEPGQHLWHVAEVTLVAAWGTAPSDDEIGRYLDVLIAANRDRLLVPTNPDLVFAGQELVVPLPPMPVR